MSLDKTITSGSPYAAVGGVVNYSYLVTNTGNVRIAGPVTVSDDKATVTCPSLSTVGNFDSFLDPGESVTCTASYTITQADLNAGSVKNTAQAHAGTTDSNTDSETATATQSPALSLDKTITSGSPYAAVGGVVNYSYLVTNTGNVRIAGPVTVSDDRATVTCPNLSTVGNLDSFLHPGDSLSPYTTLFRSQADLNAGSVKNTAQAHAGTTDSNTDSETAT